MHRKMSRQMVIILLHFNGRMYDGMEGLTFESPEPRAIKIQRNVTLDVLKRKIWMKLNLGDQTQVSSITYRFPVAGHQNIYYQGFKLYDDEDVATMFCCHDQFSNVGGIELYVEFGDGNNVEN